MKIQLSYGREVWILETKARDIVMCADAGSVGKFIRIDGTFLPVDSINVLGAQDGILCALTYKPSWVTILELREACRISYCYDNRYYRMLQ